MKYKCVNQLDKFWFRDAKLEKCDVRDGHMTWMLTGVVVRYHNPENDTLADRYIDTTQLRFLGVKITRFFVEGARYYDADGVLQKEVPDEEIPEEEYGKVFLLFSNSTVFWIKEKEISHGCCCEAAIDVTDPESDETTTYWLELEYEKAVTEWEHFMNKAMLE